MTDAPLQRNAADAEQIAAAEDAMRVLERQAEADARAELGDKESRRRQWPIVRALLGEALLNATDQALREWHGVQCEHKRRVGLWIRHARDLFCQMVQEGTARDENTLAVNRARNAGRKTT